MKIKMLGTSAATSMPLPFCNCRVCNQARKNKGKDARKRASAVINNEMLIDLGPDLCTSANLYDINISKIKYLLQTHSHTDHFDGGHFVTRWSKYATKNLEHLDIFCSMKTAQNMNHLIKENESSIDLFEEKYKKDMKYDLHILKHGEKIKYDNYTITAIDSKHDDTTDALIYVIEYENKNILYGTDLLEISKEAWRILEQIKLDLVILDQTYGIGFNSGGHLDSGQVISVIHKMKEKHIINNDTEIYATHISHEGNDIHEIMEKEAIRNGYHIAYDGLEIEI